jgi:hypothetical protein
MVLFIKIQNSFVIPAPIDDVWKVVRNFGDWSWHPSFDPECSIRNGDPADKVGCVRTVNLKDGGGTFVEVSTYYD